MRRRRTAAVLVTALTVGAVLVAVLPPDARVALTRIAVFGAGITAAALYLRRSQPATRSTPERFELELHRPTATRPVVPGLRAVEMTLRLSTANAIDFDVRLRPLLRDLARWRLQRNRGVDMDRKPEVARRILGEPLATFVEGAGAPPPFGSPGVPLADIDAGLDQLEQI
jgi:hypothetical protein